MADMNPDAICLWEFPESDFGAWCELVETPEVDEYGDYITLLAAVQADQERQGRNVVRVRMTVAEMIDALANQRMKNTPDNRAAIVALLG